MMIKRNFILLAAAGLFAVNVNAQDQPLDTLARVVSEIKTDVSKLKKLTISGYIQAQYQIADSAGEASFDGGNFAPGLDKRFMVRRGRLKAAYNNGYSSYVLQIDATEKGVILKDAFVKFSSPWTPAFSVTGGIFNRPFGFEVEYSSSSRESLERGRMSQLLFPGERDLGAMITFQMPKTSPLNFLKIDAGMFSGTGPAAVDFDIQKDFIGRIRVDRSTKNEKISYGVGLSYYNGGYRVTGLSTKLYEVGDISAGTMGFVGKPDSILSGGLLKREYEGADFQLNVDNPFGLTTFRIEYIQGIQTAPSNWKLDGTTTPTAAPAVKTAFSRHFNGAYIYLLQNIGSSKFQLIAKYDWYDPNTKVAGNGLYGSPKDKAKLLTAFSSTDVKFTTLVLGIAYRWDANVKITAQYDIVKNETSKDLAGYEKDLKDNQFSLRVQYKF